MSLTIASLGVLAHADDAAQPVWDEHGVEDFALIERSGKTVTRDDLSGHPWLAGFIFTSCAGPCPRVTAQMKQLQDQLSGSDVRLVTFTVDPAHDTLDVLRRYADSYGADPERWWFLTGEQRTIYHLIHQSFKMPVQELQGEDRKPGFEIIHSTNIMHVDSSGRVVGKYNAANDDEMARLRRVLLGQKAANLPAASSTVGRTSVRPPSPDSAAASATVPEWALRLPAVNASLNSLAAILLLWGYVLIRRGKTSAHKAVMLAAFATSIAFLGSYLVYHALAGSKPFPGTGALRQVYLAILISHVVLAAAVPFLALATIYRGLRGQWERHKRLAWVTFPIWLYVSVTGVIIYAMLYHWPTGA